MPPGQEKCQYAGGYSPPQSAPDDALQSLLHVRPRAEFHAGTSGPRRRLGSVLLVRPDDPRRAALDPAAHVHADDGFGGAGTGDPARLVGNHAPRVVERQPRDGDAAVPDGAERPRRSEPEPHGSGDDGLDPRFAWVPRRDEAGESFEKLDRGEPQFGAALRVRGLGAGVPGYPARRSLVRLRRDNAWCGELPLGGERRAWSNLAIVPRNWRPTS